MSQGSLEEDCQSRNRRKMRGEIFQQRDYFNLIYHTIFQLSTISSDFGNAGSPTGRDAEFKFECQRDPVLAE